MFMHINNNLIESRYKSNTNSADAGDDVIGVEADSYNATNASVLLLLHSY